jgi:quercetin dioxygenase-like cupin family protein
MHVAPSDLRSLRQGGLVIRFAILGPMAFIVAEVPDSGSAGTSIEQPCRLPHWALVVDGEATFQTDGTSLQIPAGHALHVPAGGDDHRFLATGGSRIAGFQPIEPSLEVSDSILAQEGFEILAPAASAGVAPIVVPTTEGRTPRSGEIDARSSSMPPYVLTVAQFGPVSGYTVDWCDAPHWGLVTSGQLVIEYEHDLEIVSAGDVYHCPAGAPAHRLEAADPATIVDLTPIDTITAGRIAEWRRATLASAREDQPSPISVVAIG